MGTDPAATAIADWLHAHPAFIFMYNMFNMNNIDNYCANNSKIYV